MTAISPWRLNLLRLAYLLLAAGLGAVIWPNIIDLTKSWSTTPGNPWIRRGNS